MAAGWRGACREFRSLRRHRNAIHPSRAAAVDIVATVVPLRATRSRSVRDTLYHSQRSAPLSASPTFAESIAIGIMRTWPATADCSGWPNSDSP
jgi:hypothetical protein